MKLVLPVLLLIYIVSEATWLYAQKGFYAKQFKSFSSKPLAIRSKLAVALVYPLLLAGFYFLVLKENTNNKLAKGILFGTVAYGVYNLTNKATLPGYSWTMLVVDTAWGAALFGALGYLGGKWYKK
jgi:uncharacterized membrane protein